MSAFVLAMLAESSVRSALLVTFVAAILALLRIRAASSKHAAWTAVLCAMLLMPLLPYAVPAVGVPISWPSTLQDHRLVENARLIEPGPGLEKSGSFGAQPRTEEHATRKTVAAIPRNQWQQTLSFTVFAVNLYVGVALMLAMRLWLGWYTAARIARQAMPVDVPQWRGAADLPAVCESATVVTPVTVGIITPLILLPLSWRRWSDEQLRAVLEHEGAHVRRRDSLINLMAHANRCLFWFHPAAWWLERTLATVAEQACDEAAVRATAAPETYARLLIDMARAIRERRGRLSWNVVGMGGSGRLGDRIDYVLSGASSPRVSSGRKVAAIVCSAAATILVVACRPMTTSRQGSAQTAIEVRDRKLRLDLEHVSIEQFSSWTLRRADLPPTDALEAAVARNPADLEALRTLLVSYWIEPPQDLSRRRSHILWLIEHRPEVDLAQSVEARLFSNELDPSFPGDPVGYQQAKTLWLAHANAPGATSRILGNAAAFFEVTDSPLAEHLLLRARAVDPAGPWTARLGRLYAVVLAGSDAPRPRNRSRKLNEAAPGGALGLRIRKTLSESRDAELLTATGWFLARGMRGPTVFRGFDPDRWALTCFQRALEVNTHAILARTSIYELQRQIEFSNGEPLWRVPPAELADSVASRPEAERFELLPRMARAACQRIESLARWNDDPLIRDRIALSREQARRFAEDALALAPRYRGHPQYGTAIFLANMTLGTLALREGDRKAAVLFLRKASRAPESEELAYSQGMASSHQWHLAGELLKQGERGAVLDFLDRMAAISLADRFELREAAAEVRRGGTPTFLVP